MMRNLLISISRLCRWISELHLYLGFFISPFILVYAVSTIMFDHKWGTGLEPKTSKEKVSIEIPKDIDGLELAKYIMREVNVSGEIEFLAKNLKQKQFVIPVMKPGQRTIINVNLEDNSAEIERLHTGFFNALLYLHKSPGPHLAGFRGNWFYTRLWKWLSDSTVYLLIFVSISGIYMWYMLKSERKIGFIVLGLGCIVFILVMFAII